MTRELSKDELDTVSGGLALSSKGLANEATDRTKDGRDTFEQVWKSISSLMGSARLTP
jgi:bacteriocin-like protein